MTQYGKIRPRAAETPVDPLAPGVTKYFDQSEGSTTPGSGGPIVAERVYYDNATSQLLANDVQTALDLLDNQVDNITGASSSLDARVDVLETEMDAAQADIVALQGRADATDTSILALQASDTNLQAQIDGLTTDLNTLDDDVAALDTRVTAAEANITTLSGRMTTAEGNITNLQGRMTTAEGSVVDLQNRMVAAETNITTLQGKTGPATEATAGIAKIATTTLVNAGADDATIITPLKLAQKLSSYTVNAATETVAGIAEIATQAEVSAGTDDARFITPKKLAAWSAAGPYVQKIGDTMTGPLKISDTVDQPNADLSITNSVSHARLFITSAGTGGKQAIMLMGTPEGKYSWGCANDTFFVWDYQRSSVPLNIAASNVATNRALGVMRAPTPGQHLHVYYTGDVYATVETDSANIAVVRLRTPQSDYGWAANGSTNNLYLWDYKRGKAAVSIDPNTFYCGPIQINDPGYAYVMVQTATNYWARLGLKNTIRNWNVNVEPAGKFVVQDETLGAVRMAIDTAGNVAFGTTVPAARLHVWNNSFTELMVQTNAVDQARIAFNNANRLWCAGNIGNEFQVWDNTAGQKRFAIDVNGNCYANGPYMYANSVSAQYIASSGHIDASVYVWAGQYISTPRLEGGPGGAGTLRGYGPQNTFCFRWDGTNFYVRIDEVQERRISIV